MERDHYLPDFCSIPVVFSVVIIGELLAFVLVLAHLGSIGSESSVATWIWSGRSWNRLALTSLFVQWVGLASAVLLCALRSWLRRRTNRFAGIFSYLLILVITAIATLAGAYLIPSPLLGAEGEPGWWFAQPATSPGPVGPSLLVLLGKNLTISAIVAAVAFRYFFVQHQWRRQLERETQARVQALQSRIRPHFLFNSMNTIASFTRSQPELAEQVVEDLAELFRVSLADARVPVTLRRELDICRQYLRIEQLRLGERLRVEWELDEVPQTALLPALTLQPLVENAVYHGIEPAPDGGVLRIAVRSGQQRVSISIRNTVGGSAGSGSGRNRAGNQMALENVRERIEVFFGAQGTVEIHDLDGSFEVNLGFPVVLDEEAAGGA